MQHKSIIILLVASLLMLIVGFVGPRSAQAGESGLKAKRSDATINTIPAGHRIDPRTAIQEQENKTTADPAPSSRGVIANDDCDSAIRVNVPSVIAGTTAGADTDPQAGPACGTAITVGGVWYTVIGTGNTITATTCGQDPVQPGAAAFDSKISVFCGICDALTCIDGNNNGCGFFFQSTVRWCSQQGTEYYIFVHGNAAQGTFMLSVYDDGTPCNNPADCASAALGACCFIDGTCIDAGETICADAGGEFQGLESSCASVKCSGLTPTNDDCSGATFLQLPSTVDGSTVFANPDSARSCSTLVNGPGVWYTVAGTGNTITATTCDGDPMQPGAADFDTKISVYCGSCNTSSCCAPGFSPGCSDAGCQAIVCAVDPYCCDIQWDSFCVAEAQFMCGDLCGPVYCVADNDDGCNGDPLASSVSWCSQPGNIYYILVHGFETQTGHFTLSVYDDNTLCDNAVSCEPCEFECAPGAIIEVEPDCGIPTDTVNGGCNSPIGPMTNCCEAHSGGGCTDATCTDLVCTIDPFCCEETWDLVCADLARQNCADCANIEYRMLPIECGQTYCSTVGANGSNRDVDWYKLVLDEPQLVEVTMTGEFTAIFGVIDNFGIDSCDGISEFLASALSKPCQPTSVFADLHAGTWYLLIAPATFSPVECQTEYEFSVSCGSLGACCMTDGSCRQERADVCAQAGGVYQGQGVDCTTPAGREESRSSSPNLLIPDGFTNGIYDEIEFVNPINVNKVFVNVEIAHTWISDLELTLTHMQSQRSAVLWRGACNGAFDLDITFDDNGGDPECGYPTTGVVDPLNVNGSPLRVFEGIDGAGTWRLSVTDTTATEVGKLVSWTMNIKPGNPAGCDEPLGRCCLGCAADCYNADGVVDVFDLFGLLSQWGKGGSCDIAPAHGDGQTDKNDLMALLSAWGNCTYECMQTTQSQCDALQGEWFQGGDCDGDPCSN